MVTKVQKWGNSQGLRLTKQVLEDAGILIGDEVDVATRDGVIVIAPVRRVRGKHNLQELVSRIPKDYESSEVEWGKPVGKEAW
jgi:antitoxin MazE